MTKKENTCSVEFLVNRVCFLFGKRTFCNSNPMKDGNGGFMPKKRYNIPLDYYEDFVSNGFIKELDESPIKKKKVVKTAKKK